MKLTRFYSEGELSKISMSSADQALDEVKSLFFDEQITEEQILLEIFSRNRGKISDVDELRLDFDRIYTQKQLKKRALISGCKLLDSADYGKDFSIKTILNIKEEERYLTAKFRGYFILLPRTKLFKSASEPLLFASLKNDNFYLLNQETSEQRISKFKKISNWIQKKISSKTSSKS